MATHHAFLLPVSLVFFAALTKFQVDSAKLLGQGCRLKGDQCGGNATCFSVPHCTYRTGIGVCWCASDQFIQPASLPFFHRLSLMRSMGASFWTDCIPMLNVDEACSIGEEGPLLPQGTVCSKKGKVQCRSGYIAEKGKCVRKSGIREVGAFCTTDRHCDAHASLKCLPGKKKVKPLRCNCVTGVWDGSKCRPARIDEQCETDADCNFQHYEYGRSLVSCHAEARSNRSKCTCGTSGFTQVPYVLPNTRILVNVTSITDNHIWTHTEPIAIQLGYTYRHEFSIDTSHWCIDYDHHSFSEVTRKLNERCTLNLPHAAPSMPVSPSVELCGPNLICHYCPTEEDFAALTGRCVPFKWQPSGDATVKHRALSSDIFIKTPTGWPVIVSKAHAISHLLPTFLSTLLLLFAVGFVNYYLGNTYVCI